MKTRRTWNIFLLSVLTCGFLLGLLFLLNLDASVGNGYAAYSSFRADPSGTKALFESLAQIPSLTVTRNFRDASLWHEHGVTMLVLGLSEWNLVHATSAELAEWERVADGNRLVLAVEPSSFASGVKNSLLASRWGLSLATPAEKDAVWRRFFGQRKGWTEREDDGGKPVVLERRFGQGGIVVIADSRIFNNKSLAEKSRADLISTVIGPYSRVEFDESHLGIEESGGVMFLARRYRLGGLLFGLSLLAALFFWKEGSVFPALPSQVEMLKPAGQGSLEGFAGLLKTHLAPSRLIEECLTQFRRTSPRDAHFEMMQTAAAQEADPLLAYLRIRAMLQKKS